jgi:hypothetical protein
VKAHSSIGFKWPQTNANDTLQNISVTEQIIETLEDEAKLSFSGVIMLLMAWSRCC